MGLIGLFETHEDFPQEVQYVSFSGLIAKVKDTGSLIVKAGQCVGHTGKEQLAGCRGWPGVYPRQLFRGMGREDELGKCLGRQTPARQGKITTK